MTKRLLLVNLRIVFPALSAVALFLFSSFYFFIPSYEKSLLEEKKNQIHQNVEIAWSMVDHIQSEVAGGLYTIEQGQQVAIEHLRDMRYGEDGKDYFWINDFTPMLVMHPYRPDLEGKDLSGYVDPQGTHLFLDFIDTVRRDREGFVRYMWQWKDDPTKVVPKISFVKEFAPWDWVIGTGIYLNDVEKAIHLLIRKVVWVSLAILLVVSGIAFYQIQQAMKNIRRKERAESELIAYKDHLEVKVAERTKDLKKVNNLLLNEIAERKTIQERNEQLIEQLRESLENIKTLKGLLPICSYCHKVRDDTGYWKAIEAYISSHSDAEFSHGICPGCLEEHFPDVYRSMQEEDERKAEEIRKGKDSTRDAVHEQDDSSNEG